jgi:putative PIN family toxin of toxin-antitoxin system
VPPRKDRIPVVLDTNVIVGYYLSRTHGSANRRIFQLWRDQRTLQLIDALVAEYLDVLERLHVNGQRIQRFAHRLQQRTTVTRIRLGSRFTLSRDPDDNMLLATAAAGKAQCVLTNDRDLLDLTLTQRRTLKFAIVTPQEFLAQFAE